MDQDGSASRQTGGTASTSATEDARRIFHPMLAGYAQGKFQGFDASGRSLDWRDWQGGGHGSEGLLVDNYHALLAVLNDVKAKRP
ncbi:MAG: hypothetical protein MUE50_00395 [Pirellulaceae bacterium]|nr:hypothetical protein [Pirellulaceae bacterium]